eukprot:XP_001697328.1 predicted protein [Chlamydomonas reinhardtii]
MRRKKHKQTRRATNYYRINYGFHEPYKVLLDGNFIHATRALKCVTKELRALGKDYAGSAAAARQFMLHKALGKIPGCPLVFCTVNGVHLETPSEAEAATQKADKPATATARPATIPVKVLVTVF